jgi:N-acetylmuramoyl-L-alanine amidase
VSRSLVICTVLAATLSPGCAVDRTGAIAHLPAPILRTLPPRHKAPIRAARAPVSKPATHAPSDWVPPGGISDRWQAIVIHHSGSKVGNARLFDKHHRNVNHWDELGYHFVIGNGTGSGDGQIEVGPRWRKQKHGAHCKTPDNFYNDQGIGICLVGDFRKSPPSPAQMASLTSLVRFLSGACGIAPARIVTHRQVTGKTECPGDRFSIRALREVTRTYTAASDMP